MKVKLEVPTVFGGGVVSGSSLEDAVNGFLSRFDPEDVRAFAQGYAAHVKRTRGVSLAQPSRVAMVRPRTATVSAQRALQQPSKATAPAAAVKHAPAPYLPPGASSRDVAWLNIVMGAGSDDPVAIDTFLQTPAGQKLYAQYLAAIR